jgi:hypothetical protein
MANEKSIIQIIQKMVQENEPEEKIIGTIKSMGVEEEQAKRLLLIAQADTFTLLSSEIDKIVQQKVDQKQKVIEDETRVFIDKDLEIKQKEISSKLEKEFLKYKLTLSDGQKQFQESVNDAISKLARLNEEVYAMGYENKKMIDTIERDLTETKLKGVKVRRSITRNTLLGIGMILFAVSVLLVINTFVSKFNIDQITGAVVFALIGTALIYLSANI